MENEENSIDDSESSFVINWIGLGAGILMLLLPFLGTWWKIALGDGVVKIAISPFKYDLLILGERLTSPLASYFVLAAKLVILVGGAFLVVGSIWSSRWWGKKLISWGCMKVFWMLTLLIIVTIIGAVIVNEVLPSMVSDAFGSGGALQFKVPYLIGSSHVEVQPEDAVAIEGPIHAGLTRSFWIAVFAAAAGIGTRVYQNKIIEKN